MVENNPYKKKHIISIMNKIFFEPNDSTREFQHDIEKLSNFSLIILDDELKPGYGKHNNFDKIYEV